MSSNAKSKLQEITSLIKEGAIDEALKKLELILENDPNNTDALCLAGSAYIRSGNEEKGFKSFEAAITSNPNSFSAHADLAFVAMKCDQIKRAITHFTKAIELKPKFYPAWGFLEKLHFQEKNYDKATHAAQQVEAFDPLDTEYKEMQNAFASKMHGKAEQIARAMIERHPGHPRAVFMLAHLGTALGAHEESIKILKYGIEYHPANTILRKALIQSLERIGAYVPAVIEAKTLCEINSDYRHWILLSKVHGHTGAYKDALYAAEEAAKLVNLSSGELGKVDLLRGHALKVLGRREQSEKAYRECIVNTPGNGAGWWGLADFKNYKFSEEDKKSMQLIADKDDGDPAQRCQAAFALAKAHELSGDNKIAFDWYKRANDLRPNIQFNADNHDDFCQKIINGFHNEMLKHQGKKQKKEATPIFIVGMPRSGSTLIEQILSSHSQIEGTMELMTLPNLERRIFITGGKKFDEKYPGSLKHFNSDDLTAFGKNYIHETQIYRTNKPFFIDKLPANFERIGLIHKILPEAIIIDARRNPMDCGFSSYKQHFASGYEFSYNLRNIGRYYNAYLRIMDHFNTVLPNRIFLINYEENITNIEKTTKKLLEHIGLDFENSCLEFYKNKRSVRTASSEQVRQPIYTQSIGAWKKFSGELEPLKKELGTKTINRFEQL